MNKNLFETYKVNGKTYTDNLGINAMISIPKKQYIEYEQQKEEIERLTKRLEEAQLGYLAVEEKNKRLHSIIKEVREYIEKNYDDYEEFIYGKDFKEKILEILDKESK